MNEVADVAIRSEMSGADPATINLLRGEIGHAEERAFLPSLMRILTGSVPFWRLNAAMALRKIGSPESVPTFVRLLDDPDPLMQYTAVISLKEITKEPGLEYGPSMRLFDQNPHFYTTLWKAWWTEKGKAAYGAH